MRVTHQAVQLGDGSFAWRLVDIPHLDAALHAPSQTPSHYIFTTATRKCYHYTLSF